MLNHNHRCPPFLLRYLGGAGVLAATLLGACGSPPPAATPVVGQHRAPLGSYPVLSLTPPPGARSVELWFLGSNDGPCTDWDSDYGRNYSFPISP